MRTARTFIFVTASVFCEIDQGLPALLKLLVTALGACSPPCRLSKVQPVFSGSILVSYTSSRRSRARGTKDFALLLYCCVNMES